MTGRTTNSKITRRTALTVGAGLAAAAAGRTVACAQPAQPAGASHSPRCSGQDDFLLSGVRNVRRIAKLTGPDAMNNTLGIGFEGGDLESMFTVGNRTYFLFGDNFADRAPGQTGGGGGIWRSNALAWTTDDNPADGIRLDGWATGANGKAAEILPGRHEPDNTGEVTRIPTQGWAIGHTLYAAYMSVRHWGAAGEWDANEARLARSTDMGRSWTILTDASWPGDSGFVQLAHAEVVSEGRRWMYQWGIPSGRFGPVRLMRMPYSTAGVENPKHWQYFAGLDRRPRPRWSPKLSDAQIVLDRQTAELSVLWSPRLRRWLMTTMDANSPAVLYEGVNPWGPWSQPHTILTQEQCPGLYGPYTDPRYVSRDGTRIYFTLSIWDPYNVFWYSMDLVGSRRK